MFVNLRTHCVLIFHESCLMFIIYQMDCRIDDLRIHWILMYQSLKLNLVDPWDQSPLLGGMLQSIILIVGMHGMCAG